MRPDHAAKLRATNHIAERRRRDVAFGRDSEVFGEPAWDILLRLFPREDLSFSELLSASTAPDEITRPYLAELLRRKLVAVIDFAENDVRFVLTTLGRTKMVEALEPIRV